MENCAIEADTVISENKNKISILQAQAALQITQSDFNKNMEIANIESKQASAIREAQLQQQVEVKRAMVEEERRRGDTYAKAVIEAEKKIVAADAALYKAKKEADAALYMQGKVAEGIKAVYDARAEGIKDLYSAFGNDENATLRFLMLERGVYTTLAKINATAIQGLDPSITVWDTGDQTKDGANPTIKSVLQTLPPMLTTIKDQTGVSPPTWLANLQKSSTNLA